MTELLGKLDTERSLFLETTQYVFNLVWFKEYHHVISICRLSQCEMAELKARLEENEVLLHSLQQRLVTYFIQLSLLILCS